MFNNIEYRLWWISSDQYVIFFDDVCMKKEDGFLVSVEWPDGAMIRKSPDIIAKT